MRTTTIFSIFAIFFVFTGCDRDEDGIPNGKDNCPDTFNIEQEDMDDNGIGDACDDDIDGDGVLNEEDSCPRNREDFDIFWPSELDMDNDGVGDACDDDIDGDGIPNGEDNCRRTVNPGQENQDRDGLGDACDDDVDGDYFHNNIDPNPLIPQTYNNRDNISILYRPYDPWRIDFLEERYSSK